MCEPLFSSKDIDEQTLIYINRYFKLTISNTKRNFIRNTFRFKQHGITFVALENCEHELIYEEPGFDKAVSEMIEVNGEKITIHNPSLVLALRSLSHLQRTVLLQNVILRIPLEKIATNLGIGRRMVSRHKHNAIIRMKRSLKDYEK